MEVDVTMEANPLEAILFTDYGDHSKEVSLLRVNGTEPISVKMSWRPWKKHESEKAWYVDSWNATLEMEHEIPNWYLKAIRYVEIRLDGVLLYGVAEVFGVDHHKDKIIYKLDGMGTLALKKYEKACILHKKVRYVRN